MSKVLQPCAAAWRFRRRCVNVIDNCGAGGWRPAMQMSFRVCCRTIAGRHYKGLSTFAAAWRKRRCINVREYLLRRRRMASRQSRLGSRLWSSNYRSTYKGLATFAAAWRSMADALMWIRMRAVAVLLKRAPTPDQRMTHLNPPSVNGSEPIGDEWVVLAVRVAWVGWGEK